MNSYENKKVLLIGGGGTLGTYVARELLSKGAYVDIVCPEEKQSNDDKLCFFRGLGTREFLSEIFKNTHYNGIVNFIHYPNAKSYEEIHDFLMENTDHLIYLSSYRVYADVAHPVTESAPRLYDVIDDEELLTKETYAISKSKNEDFLRNEHAGENWTIVRPVISFSERRLDLLLYSSHEVLDYAEKGIEMPMPELVRNYRAGLDWAGNSGKLIANLLFKPDAIGETFTIYSGHGMTWGEVAEAYTELTGVKIRWCSEEEFVEHIFKTKTDRFIWKYDRRYNRDIDASKVLRVTGLSKEDFSTVREGIKIELARIENGDH